MNNMNRIGEALVIGNSNKVYELVEEAFNNGISAEAILNDGLLEGMNVVGEKFKDGEFFIPQVLMAAKAMQSGMDLIKPKLSGQSSYESQGVILLGTVAGDLHDIGKKLIGMMLVGAGFEIIDAGVNVTSDRFIEMIKEKKPDIIGMSAMLTTTMKEMDTVIKKMKEDGLLDKVKVMIGGAPVTEKYAQEIGANYSYDAATAVDLAKRLISAV